MNREILFLRHGKAARPSGVDDFDRPLTDRGLEQARKIGTLLRERGLLPDAVISSPALRAIQTADAALGAMGCGRDLIRTDRRLYFDPREKIMVALSEVPAGSARLLVVGHNPWMEELVEDLADGRVPHPGGNWIMKTGALMRFAVDDFAAGLSAGRGRLLDHIIPDRMPSAGRNH